VIPASAGGGAHRRQGIQVIHATDIYTYYRPSECARRVWLEANRPDLRGPLSELEELMRLKGREHEQAHLHTFPEYVRPSYSPGDLVAGADATAALLSERKPVIYQGVLTSPDDDLVAIPDFLIREGDGYVVREAKLVLNLEHHPEIPAQLGLHANLLQKAVGIPPARTEVLLAGGELTAVEATPNDALLQTLKAIKALNDEPDEAVGWTKCNTCGYFDHCWPEAVAAHDPAVVPGIEQSLRHVLRKMGYARYEDLVEFTTSDLAEIRFPRGRTKRRVGDKTAEKVLRQVHVLVSGRMQTVARPELPSPGPVVYFDIESNPWDIGMETAVYLWGIMIDRSPGSAPEYWGRIAPAGTDGDREAWFAFLAKAQEVIQTLGDVPFIHFSDYEKTWVGKYADRWGDPEGIAARVLTLLWDMRRKAVLGHLCLPIHSYGLKHVEECAGFKRTQQDYGALWSVGRYNAYLEATDDAERKKIEEELLTYNREDCLAMRHVLEWARDLG